MKYTAEELLKRRLAGVLPKVMIVDTWYLVDAQHHELRAATDATKRIDLDSLPLTEDGNNYRFYFDPMIGVVKPSETKDTVLVILPHEKILDPVGVARAAGLNDRALLDRYPVISAHFASVSYPQKQKVKKVGGLLRKILKKKRGI